jgi:hypothetical protein
LSGFRIAKIRAILPSSTTRLMSDGPPASSSIRMPSDFRVERGLREGPQQICHLLRAVHRHPNGLGDAATVGDEYDVRRQHVHQALHIPGGDRRQEPFDDFLLLAAAHAHAGAPGGHMRAGTADDLAHGGR